MSPSFYILYSTIHELQRVLKSLQVKTESEVSATSKDPLLPSPLHCENGLKP